MKTGKFLTGCLFAAVLYGPAFAQTTVNVELWDKGGMMDMTGDMQWGMGMHGDPKMALMGIKVDKTEVPAGMVTFDVKNISKEVIHEMLVAPIKSTSDVLPYIDNEDRIDEAAAGDLGEVSELDPGGSGALTLDLKPGLYLLFCNVPEHFRAGMWTTVTVTP